MNDFDFKYFEEHTSLFYIHKSKTIIMSFHNVKNNEVISQQIRSKYNPADYQVEQYTKDFYDKIKGNNKVFRKFKDIFKDDKTEMINNFKKNSSMIILQL